jgi:hypothetical protein
MGIRHVVFTTQRKAMAEMKKQPPDLLVADFFYGYGNNYAGANVSNLDVMLRSLQRFSPSARVVVLAGPQEIIHVSKLEALFDLHAVIRLPTTAEQVAEALA